MFNWCVDIFGKCVVENNSNFIYYYYFNQKVMKIWGPKSNLPTYLILLLPAPSRCPSPVSFFTLWSVRSSLSSPPSSSLFCMSGRHHHLVSSLSYGRRKQSSNGNNSCKQTETTETGDRWARRRRWFRRDKGDFWWHS